MGGIRMKATELLDEWKRTNTSSPSFQDVLDWAERKQAEEMKDLNNEWRVTLALQRQVIIQKAFRWLKENIDGGVHPSSAYGFADRFLKAMEE